MVHMGMQMDESEVDEFIRDVDVDGDGQINYEEFVRMMGPSSANTALGGNSSQ